MGFFTQEMLLGCVWFCCAGRVFSGKYNRAGEKNLSEFIYRHNISNSFPFFFLKKTCLPFVYVHEVNVNEGNSTSFMFCVCLLSRSVVTVFSDAVCGLEFFLFLVMFLT